MMTKINLTTTAQENWFQHCQDIFCINHNLRPKKKSRYYDMDTVSRLTNLDYQALFTLLVNSITIHAFMYENQVFIHPNGFERMFMEMMRANAKEAIERERVYH